MRGSQLEDGGFQVTFVFSPSRDSILLMPLPLRLVPFSFTPQNTVYLLFEKVTTKAALCGCVMCYGGLYRDIITKLRSETPLSMPSTLARVGSAGYFPVGWFRDDRRRVSPV